jgi:hypothetical protein
MYWITKLIAAKSGAYKPLLGGCMLGIVGICFSLSALADPGSDSEMIAWISEHSEIISDTDLSAIKGKGGSAIKLDGAEKPAVILWDERGNTDRRGAGYRSTSYEVNGGQNYQSVTLTVNGR